MNADVLDEVPANRALVPGSYSTGNVVQALVGTDHAEARACERMIHYWRMNGSITPSIRFTGGSGSWVRWSTEDVERLRRIWALRQQMHRYDMNLSSLVITEMWAALRDGRPWTMRIELDLDQNDLTVETLSLNPSPPE